jgi:hypothetical protein
MTHSSQLQGKRRAPRVSLRISVTIRLENGRQLPAKLHQLSITGGLLEIGTYLEERSVIGLTLYVGSSIVYPKAELLFPMPGGLGYLQPFRITNLREEELHLLDREITELLKQTSTPAKPIHGSGFRPPRFYLDSY